MSIEVSSNYAGYYSNTLSDSKTRKSKQTAEVKSNTSASSKDKVQEYYEKLCKKFPKIIFNTSSNEMRCSPNKVVINLSYECLKKMANDPEFAKKVEFSLSGEVEANARTYAMAKRNGVEIGGPTVTYDANGHSVSSCGGMWTANTGSGNSSTKKLQEKNREEQIRKKREEQEKMEAHRREKRRQQEEFEKRMEERRKDREAYFDHIVEDSGKLGPYKSSSVVQPTAYFDTNI